MDKSRRQILKLIAAAPLAIPLGFAGEAFMRFLKPSMSPFGIFDPADLPTSAIREAFQFSDFPEPWTCIPFLFHLKFVEFNAEQREIRYVPAFAIRLGRDDFIAYSRFCPARGCILNYVANPRDYNRCGCALASNCSGICCCANNPVLKCPCDGSTFDLADGGRVICGPARRPPRKIQLERQGDSIVVISLEAGSIA